jgi:hypothetical protein
MLGTVIVNRMGSVVPQPRKMIEPSAGVLSIEEGPIRHHVLPDDFLQRVRAYKEILREVDNVALDEVIDDFRRDAHPEREIAVWERIAHTYALFLSHNPTDNLAVKRDIFSVVLMASLGVENGTEIRHLTQDQIRHLMLNYKGL